MCRSPSFLTCSEGLLVTSDSLFRHTWYEDVLIPINDLIFKAVCMDKTFFDILSIIEYVSHPCSQLKFSTLRNLLVCTRFVIDIKNGTHLKKRRCLWRDQKIQSRRWTWPPARLSARIQGSTLFSMHMHLPCLVNWTMFSRIRGLLVWTILLLV